MKIEFLGNCELLHLPKTAFLASSTIPVDMVLPCYDWAMGMRNEGRCVISGFNSRLEKDVLNFLIKGEQPIIMVRSCKMWKHVPQDIKPFIDEGRLLVISTSNELRLNKRNALVRNRYICELADEILFVGAIPTSSLYPLSIDYASKIIDSPK